MSTYDPTPPVPAGPSPRGRRLLRWRPTSLVDKLLLGTGLVLVLLAVVGALGTTVVTNRVLDDVETLPGVFGSIDSGTRPAKPAGAEKTRNLLLVGVDTGAGSGDTGASSAIMVMHLAADRRSATVVSIPRDSWVEVPGRGADRLSSAYASGGPSLLVRSVERLTGLRMDNFVLVDFAGFRDITDAVGGVDVRQPGGVRALDGEATLAYLRERSGGAGDLRRIERQQQVMKALMARVGSRSLLSSPAGTLRIADSVARSLSVDETLDRGALRSLAFSLRSLKPDQVTFRTTPVREVDRVGRQTVVRLDTAAGRDFWSGIGRA